MKILSTDEIAIRLATTQSLDVSGRKQVAALLETDAARICRLENTENTEHAAADRRYLKASEAVKMDRLAGRPYIIGRMAALVGYSVHKLEAGVAAEGMHKHLACIAKEFGEALTEMADAAADNKTTIAEAKAIYASLHDARAKIEDAMCECERVIAGEQRPTASVSELRAV